MLVCVVAVKCGWLFVVVGGGWLFVVGGATNVADCCCCVLLMDIAGYVVVY